MSRLLPKLPWTTMQVQLKRARPWRSFIRDMPAAVRQTILAQLEVALMVTPTFQPIHVRTRRIYSRMRTARLVLGCSDCSRRVAMAMQVSRRAKRKELEERTSVLGSVEKACCFWQYWCWPSYVLLLDFMWRCREIRGANQARRGQAWTKKTAKIYLSLAMIRRGLL